MATGRRRRTIYLVEDDRAAREAMQRVLQTHGYEVESHASAESFLAGFRALDAACLILDVRLGRHCGLDLLAQLSARHTHVPVIFVTAHADVSRAVRAMRLGALDFLQKPVDTPTLLRRVDEAMQARTTQADHASLIEEIRQRTRDLTDAEREILAHIGRGMTSEQIAEALHRSHRTIENHRHHIKQKLGAAHAADVLRVAIIADVFGVLRRME